MLGETGKGFDDLLGMSLDDLEGLKEGGHLGLLAFKKFKVLRLHRGYCEVIAVTEASQLVGDQPGMF